MGAALARSRRAHARGNQGEGVSAELQCIGVGNLITRQYELQVTWGQGCMQAVGEMGRGAVWGMQCVGDWERQVVGTASVGAPGVRKRALWRQHGAICEGFFQKFFA